MYAWTFSGSSRGYKAGPCSRQILALSVQFHRRQYRAYPCVDTSRGETAGLKEVQDNFRYDGDSSRNCAPDRKKTFDGLPGQRFKVSSSKIANPVTVRRVTVFIFRVISWIIFIFRRKHPKNEIMLIEFSQKRAVRKSPHGLLNLTGVKPFQRIFV